MSYSTDVANLLAGQLAKFVTLNRHQLAGQVANLDFWLAEVRLCLDVLDGYGQRFERLRAAQGQYVSEHRVVEFEFDDPCCTEGTASPPTRIAHAKLKEARRSLCEAAYRFLVRCVNEGFIEERTLRQACTGLKIGVEASDIRPRGKRRGRQ